MLSKHGVHLAEDGVVVQTEEAKARVERCYDALGVRDNNQTPYGLDLLDAFQTDDPRVWEASWTSNIAGVDFLIVGYVCIASQVNHWAGNLSITRQLFHSHTYVEALEEAGKSLKAEETVERVRVLWRNSKEVTRPMVRALGWCDPGINNWVATNAKDVVKDDRIGVKDLYEIAKKADYYDHYGKTLVHLLKDNIHVNA